jgi:signal transduction histidine kinase
MTGNATLLLSINEQIAELLSLFNKRRAERDVSASHLGLEAFQLAKESGNKELIYDTSSAMAQFYMEVLSEFQKALDTLEESIVYFDEASAPEKLSEIWRRKGLGFDYTGELLQSKNAYEESIRILENAGTLSDSGFLTLARSYFNLSIIYGGLNLDTLSEKFLHLSFEKFKQVDFKPGIARCYISFGVLYDEESETNEEKRKEAKEHYKKAVELAHELQDWVCYSVALGNFGLLHAQYDNFEEGVKHLQDAYEKALEHSNKSFVHGRCFQLGVVYQRAQKFEEAHYWYGEADKLFKEMNAKVDGYGFYKKWAEVLMQLGQYKEAAEKMMAHDHMREEKHQQDKSAAVNDVMLRIKYEEGKKEQALLRKKNAEIEEYTRKLEVSNYELNQFAHVASHDMKEPLRMIANYSQLLEKSINGQLKPEQKEYLVYINDGAKRMNNVIQSLLQLSKINAANKKTVVNVNDVIDEVKKALKLEIHNRNVSITCSNLTLVMADETKLTQLFQNLISNAIKYNQSAAPVIDIRCTEQENAHRFEVADNGIGIEKQYRDKVFIIFQRLHTRTEYEGTGIGLSICKKIIDGLQGKIWIEDSPLGGTKFCFTIPKQ